MTKTYIPDSVIFGTKKDNVAMSNRLGFLTYKDDKGVLRKEKTFMDWIDKKSGIHTIDNKPRSGFIINRHIDHYAYDFGNDRVRFRVFCPQDDGFEFEITPMNLSYILSMSDVSKREIVEPCVFAWLDNELMLLPVNSKHYQEAVENTSRRNNFKQIQKEVNDDFKFGDVLQTKTGNFILYLGEKEFMLAGDLKRSVEKLSPEKITYENGNLMFTHEIEKEILGIKLNEDTHLAGKTYIYASSASFVRVNPKNYMLSERTFDSFNPTEKLERLKKIFEDNQKYPYADQLFKVMDDSLSTKNKFVFNLTKMATGTILKDYYNEPKNSAVYSQDFAGKKTFKIRFIGKDGNFIQIEGKAVNASKENVMFSMQVFVNKELAKEFSGTLKELFDMYPDFKDNLVFKIIDPACKNMLYGVPNSFAEFKTIVS